VADGATCTAGGPIRKVWLSVAQDKSELLLRTQSDAGMLAVRRCSLSVDVSTLAPAGCRRIAADLFVSQSVRPTPLLWVCIPGGGISRRYFDLDVAGQNGTFSMARHLAAGGDVVVTVDPPGVGESDVPDDGYALTPRVVADVLAAAFDRLGAELGSDAFAAVVGLSGVVPRAVVGLGHSAGALLVAFQQAHHHSYDVVALFGFSASGLPDVLNEDELRYAGHPERLSEDVKNLTRARFGEPLPEWSNSTGEFGPRAVSAQVDMALAAASSRLLAQVGMTAIVPGSVQPELDELRIPIFAALGEHDLGGTLDVLPGQLPACGDLTLFLLQGAGHNHNVAVNRRLLWDRVARWATSVTS
jgi:pimeloyl-ACP methyl ester carboxylesterase